MQVAFVIFIFSGMRMPRPDTLTKTACKWAPPRKVGGVQTGLFSATRGVSPAIFDRVRFCLHKSIKLLI
jgi:hypothetical protein